MATDRLVALRREPSLDFIALLAALLERRPLASFDARARAALTVLASDIATDCFGSHPFPPLGAVEKDFRLLFVDGRHLRPNAIEAFAAQRLLGSRRAPFPYPATWGDFELELATVSTWLDENKAPIRIPDLERALLAIPNVPWMEHALARVRQVPGTILGSWDGSGEFRYLWAVSLPGNADSARIPIAAPFRDPFEINTVHGRTEFATLVWTGPGGVRVASGFEFGRQCYPSTRAFLSTLAPHTGLSWPALVLAFLKDPAFAPLLPMGPHDQERKASGHFEAFMARVDEAIRTKGAAHTSANRARMWINLGIEAPLFSRLIEAVRRDEAELPELLNAFSDLWSAGTEAFVDNPRAPFRAPSALAMLKAMGVRLASSPRKRPTERVRRNLGLWRAMRTDVRAVDLCDDALLRAGIRLEAEMRGSLDHRGLPHSLLPRVSFDRRPSVPEVRFDAAHDSLVLHPRVLERAWAHVSDCGLWALAHRLEAAYSGKMVGFPLSEAEKGVDPWVLACRRLGLRAELREARLVFEDLPSETWLEEDGLDDDEKRFLEKVDKLLALSASSNEHESALAMERAQALLERRGVQRRGTISGPGTFVSLTLSLGVKLLTEAMRALGSLLMAHYDVRIVWATEFEPVSGDSYRTLTLLGRKESVLLAEHVFDFLEHQMVSLWKRARAERDLEAKARLSFQLGLIKGFHAKLDAAQAERRRREREGADDSTTAILRLERIDLDAYVAQVYPKLVSLHRRHARVHEEGYSAGQEEGARISVHTPVSGPRTGTDGPTYLPGR